MTGGWGGYSEIERLRDDRERRHPNARDAVTPKERAVQVQSDMDESFKRAIKTGQSLAKLHQPLRHEAVDIIERAIAAAVAEEREQCAALADDFHNAEHICGPGCEDEFVWKCIAVAIRKRGTP